MAVLALAAAIIATIAYVRRDYLARNIANSMLGEQDLVVAELSVASMSPNRLELGRLVVVSASGARYELNGLSMPLAASQGVRQMSADGLTVSYDGERATRSLLSETLQKVLDFSAIQPHLAITVAKVRLPGLPELTDVAWATTVEGQTFAYSVDGISSTISVTRIDERQHRVVIQSISVAADEVFSADVVLASQDDKFTATGQAMIDTAAWLPVLRPLNILPNGVERLEAKLHGPVDIKFDDLEAGAIAIATQPLLSHSMNVVYTTAGGQATAVQLDSIDDFSIEFTYPRLDWLATAQQSVATVTTDGFSAIPVVLSKIECRSGIRCSLNARLAAGNYQWNAYTFEAVNLDLPLDIEVGETTRIDFSPNSGGSFSGVRSADMSAESIRIKTFSGTRLIIDDSAWRCRIDKLGLAVEQFKVAGKLVASFPLTLSDIDIRDSAAAIDTQLLVDGASTTSWDGLDIFLPDVTGTVSIDASKLTSAFKVSDHRSALTASVRLDRNLLDDSGSLSIDKGRLAFNEARLSQLLPQWSFPWDIVDGAVDAELSITWHADAGATTYKGTLTGRLDGLAGNYNDIAFVGLDTNIAAALDSTSGIDVKPSSIAIRLLDVGLPLEHIVADYAVDANDKSVAVETLSLAALGGSFTADPFRVSASGAASTVMLRARAVQLQLMLDVAEFKDIRLTGALSGVLPMTINGKSISIEGGRLESDAPGGVIHYGAGEATLEAVVPDSRLNFVTRALNNFEFDSLTSDVAFTESGDLKLQMRLSGINPDLDPTQPIILNLGIEDNVPQLLRSLRAVRSIEDILEGQTLN